MKQTLIFFIFNLFVSHVWGQSSTVYDTTDKYYSKTNFGYVDTVEHWTFTIDTSYRADLEDTIKPIGSIAFMRNVKMYDKKYFAANKKLWYPYLSFEIFYLRDSLFCSEESKLYRRISSCTAPDVGGDLLVIGDFILLNRYVCLHVRKWDDDIDYARPVINNILSNINQNKIHSLTDFITVLPIKGKFL